MRLPADQLRCNPNDICVVMTDTGSYYIGEAVGVDAGGNCVRLNVGERTLDVSGAPKTFFARSLFGPTVLDACGWCGHWESVVSRLLPHVKGGNP